MADQDVATLVSATTAANSQTNVIFTGISDGADLALVDGSGNLQVILASNDGVDIGDVDVTSVVPGVGATNLGKAEDAVHTSGDVGVAMLVLRQDSQSNLTADGDYTLPTVNSTGELRVTSASITANAEKAEDSAHTTGDIGNYVLAVRQDTLANSTTADADYASFKVNTLGSLYTLAEAQPGVDIGDVTVNNASGASAVNIQDGGNTITVDGAVTVSATDLDIRDLTSVSDSVEVLQATHGSLNANVTLQINDVDVSATVPVPISATAAANTEVNPIFVKSVDTVVSASEVHNFNTATVAAAGTNNHDYTITGTTGFLKQVHYASSGPLKVEIQTGPVAGLVTIGVRFLPRAGGGDVFDISSTPREVPVTSTGTIRVIRTNRDPGLSIDVYSTIVLNDV